MATSRTSRARVTSAKPPRDTIKPNGLNLDKLVREGGPEEPYRCVLGGRVFTFADPLELDWQEANSWDPNDVVALVRNLLDEDEWERFKQHRLELWKIVRLAEDLQAHYRITPADAGKGTASQPSSNGTAPL